MAGVSKIKRLPRELQDMVNGMFERGFSITEVSQALEKAGEDISRSSVGRYHQDWLEAMKELILVREFSEMTVRGLKDMPESKIARMNVQLIEAGIFKAITALGTTFQTDPEKAVKLLTKAAMAQAMLARAAKDDADKTIKATDYAEEKAQELQQDENNTLTIEFVSPEAAAANPAQAAKAKTAKKPTKAKAQ